ncbi:hypothetical protein D3C85_1540440 [compost metagenome]
MVGLVAADDLGSHLPEQGFFQLVVLVQEDRHLGQGDEKERITGEIPDRIQVVGEDERVAVELGVTGWQRHQGRAQLGTAQVMR